MAGAFRELLGRVGLKALEKFEANKPKRDARKARRAAKKAAKHPEAAEAVNSEYFNEERNMDIRLFATQAVLGILRHAMTALAPLGIVVTDDWLMQTAGLIVGVAGLVWSLRRKAKAAAA